MYRNILANGEGLMAETIHPASIVDETRRRYLTYALSVISSRALPDVRDGLKPVQRRILYTMYHDLHLHADGRPRKCSKIVGDVMGNYHPHGNMAIYDALVRLSQDFVMREPLVDGQGNFGSVDGDPPAADRYTEAKLTALSDHLMRELKQNTVDMRANYDSTRDEPVVLPAQFPNILVNGVSGIAVGMATNIPPHNLGEVIKAATLLIENPEATTAQLLDKLKGPDFPLGGKIITDRATLRSIYEEGTGSIKVQAEWKVETVAKREQIVITSIPYGVNKGNLEAAIGAIIAERKLPQLTDLLNDTSEKAGLRIVLEMKPDADPNLIMAYLYKHTALQDNFSVNMTCLSPSADGVMQPARIGLKEILRHFLDFRFATVRKRFEFELEQLRRRIHILEGFAIIFDALDKAIRIIRESEGKADAAEKLIRTFKIDDIQANAILEAQLYRIAQMEIQKILEELREKTREAARIETILRSDKKLWGVVNDELTALGEEFGERRRTKLGADETPDFDPEAYIVKENTNVVLTRDGWIKRVGRLESVDKTRVREGDAVIAVAAGSTLEHVVFFADDGAAFTMRMNEVPASSGYGEPLAKYFRLGDQARIVNAITTDERFLPASVPGGENGEPAGPYVLVATERGYVLRVPLSAYRTASNKLGRRYVRLAEGDRVVWVAVPRDEESLFLASATGHVIHFLISEVNVLSGAGRGVIGIKLADDDRCLGGALIGNRFDMMQVETAGEKTIEFRRGKYEVTSRGGKGFPAVKRTTFIRILPPPIELVNWDEQEPKKNEGPANGSGGGTTLFD